MVTLVTAPLAPQILKAFGTDRFVYQTLIVSIWELGEVVGPLIYGPLSEEYGRAPVIHVCNALLVVFTVSTALSTNVSMLLAFRFLSGLVVASAAICPGIIGDMFVAEQRGTPMTVMILASMGGPAVGPIISAYIGQAKGWRWGIWIAAILCGAISLLLLATFRETYKVVILRRRAEALQTANHHVRYHTRYSDKEHSCILKRLARSFSRPMLMLFTSPVLAVLTLYVGVSNGYVYLVFTIMAPIFQNEYRFSQGASGLVYLGLVAGLVFGVVFCGYIFDVYVKKLRRVGINLTPEKRLPPAIISGFIAPVGFFIFGWTVQYNVPWIVPIIATALIGFSYIAVSLVARIYVVDAFGIHAVSAMSANLVVRNLTAAFLPLAAPPMYSKLGYGWGNTVLGFIALALVAIPVLLIKFGARLRASGSYRVEE